MKTFTNNRTARGVTLACVAGLAASAVTSISFASPSLQEATSVRVRYDDLNLATGKGTSALYQRIEAAARKVCPDYRTRDLGLIAATASCRADAVARAVSGLHNPQLAMVSTSHVRGY